MDPKDQMIAALREELECTKLQLAMITSAHLTLLRHSQRPAPGPAAVPEETK